RSCRTPNCRDCAMCFWRRETRTGSTRSTASRRSPTPRGGWPSAARIVPKLDHVDFDLTPEQQSIRKLAKDFADKEIAPGARERDRGETFPKDVLRKMAPLGLLGGPVPEKYGGIGLDFVSHALVTEEVGRADSSVRTTLSVQISLVEMTILKFGTEEQKQRWLPSLCKGEIGDGFKVAMTALDSGRYSVAAGAVGVAQACIDASVQYATTRKTFGKPIAGHQLVQELIADMVVETEAARLLVWRAGDLKDKGRPNTRETSIAKLYASEAAQRAADNAIQIHGGYGFSDEFPVERYWRDARVNRLYEGTTQIQKLIVGRFATGIDAIA